MNKTTIVAIVGVVFLSGIAVGIWYSGDTKLERQIACAEFKDEAERRIKDYYAPEEVSNYTPDEIFYSEQRDSCIVVWQGGFSNENGIFAQKAIFDAITNEDLFSNLFWNGATMDDEDKQVQAAMNTSYFELLTELKDK